MIAGFRHKGLKLFYDKGNASKLQPQHVVKIRLILTRLDAATSPGDMNVPGYGLHQLAGDWAGFWAVKVDKNFRIVFRFDGLNMLDVDYLDYH
ncbi:MAG: type II toxin-antitoxin system RelE/ParE family toxin [Bacteroidota bacterium]|nr:type II toxin-antitoxin system RelE/ParE family toxin [Bacteroidota bacterium]